MAYKMSGSNFDRAHTNLHLVTNKYNLSRHITIAKVILELVKSLNLKSLVVINQQLSYSIETFEVSPETRCQKIQQTC